MSPQPSANEQRAWDFLRRTVDEVQPSHVFALFSGGHDSLCATHLTMTAALPIAPEVLHINTGTGIPKTLEFVRETCRRYGWPLKEYQSDERYEDIVLEHGFPGPGAHGFMYIRLKERAIQKVLREHRAPLRWRQRKILFVTGVRSQESTRRMGHVEPLAVEGRIAWAAPIMGWSHADKHAHIRDNALPKNEVVERLCMSGECLCGAFAKKDELREIELWYPNVARRIRALEVKVACAGQHAIWGTRPPREDKRQLAIPGMLCWSCANKSDAEGQP